MWKAYLNPKASPPGWKQMPADCIHLLLSLEDLFDLLPTVIRDSIWAFILAPEVLRNLAGPVNVG